MNTPTDSVASELFKFTDLAGCVLVTAGIASPPQLAALSNLLVQKRQVHRLFEIRQTGNPWPESLRISGKTRQNAEALLAGLSSAELEQESARLIRAQQDFEARMDFERKLGEMSLVEFMKLFCAHSGDKLRMKAFQPHFIVTASELLPVTHFKALARMTDYNGRTREFSASHLSQAKRVKLLELATKIGKSKKKVTREDILARRKRIREKHDADSGPLHMDFYEASEDFGNQKALEWLRQGRLDEPAPKC